MSGTSYLPIATDNTITPLRALLWEVRYRTKAFNIRCSSWTRTSSWSDTTPEWLEKRSNQLSAECNMAQGFVSLLQRQLVKDVSIYNCNFKDPKEDLTPPLDLFVKEAVMLIN